MSSSRSHVLDEVASCLNSVALSLINRTNGPERQVMQLDSLLLLIEESDITPELEVIHTLIREAMDAIDGTLVPKRGRPALIINICRIESLLSMNFRLNSIAEMFNVSTRTLYRRLKRNGISVNQTYAMLTDAELDSEISRILMEFPNTGYKRMLGFLRSRNLKVQQFRVRESMRRVDPQGVYLRSQQNRAIVRRQYYVKYSNALWHIDTNLKLERWNIVIRGGVDGKSRTCVYLEAGNNNRAEENYKSFLKGVGRYGIPYRVRSDKGGENRQVAEFMLNQRGVSRGSHICGKSVHNQRIERFWRDLGYGLISFYRQVFLWLENRGFLNVEDPLHMLSLHYVYLPRINLQLEDFMNAWNSHPLSTEGNKTPQQLMLINLPPPEYDMIMSQEDFREEFLINDSQDLNLLQQEGIHNFSSTYPEISEEILRELRGINPLRLSTEYGKDIYSDVLNVISGVN